MGAPTNTMPTTPEKVEPQIKSKPNKLMLLVIWTISAVVFFGLGVVFTYAFMNTLKKPETGTDPTPTPTVSETTTPTPTEEEEQSCLPDCSIDEVNERMTEIKKLRNFSVSFQSGFECIVPQKIDYFDESNYERIVLKEDCFGDQEGIITRVVAGTAFHKLPNGTWKAGHYKVPVTNAQPYSDKPFLLSKIADVVFSLELEEKKQDETTIYSQHYLNEGLDTNDEKLLPSDYSIYVYSLFGNNKLCINGTPAQIQKERETKDVDCGEKLWVFDEDFNLIEYYQSGFENNTEVAYSRFEEIEKFEKPQIGSK